MQWFVGIIPCVLFKMIFRWYSEIDWCKCVRCHISTWISKCSIQLKDLASLTENYSLETSTVLLSAYFKCGLNVYVIFPGIFHYFVHFSYNFKFCISFPQRQKCSNDSFMTNHWITSLRMWICYNGIKYIYIDNAKFFHFFSFHRVCLNVNSVCFQLYAFLCKMPLLSVGLRNTELSLEA